MTLRQLVEDGLHDAMLAGYLSAGVDRIAVANGIMERLLGEKDAPRGVVDPDPLPQPPPGYQRPAELELVLLEAADLFGWRVDDIVGAEKVRPLVDARHVAMYVARNGPRCWSYPQIGRAFGGRDHSTVVNAVQRIERERRRDRRIADAVAALVAAVSDEAAA